MTSQASPSVQGPGVSSAPLSVALADYGGVAQARRLADRLIVAGIGVTVGAAANGFRVWVRRADVEDAKVLLALFDEIDAGVSRVAPAPRSLWQRGVVGRAVAISILVVSFVLLLALLRLAALR